jgi:hypothetical protein
MSKTISDITWNLAFIRAQFQSVVIEFENSVKELDKSSEDYEDEYERLEGQAREAKDKIFAEHFNKVKGVKAFAAGAPADFKVAFTSDNSWHPISYDSTFTIGRVVDLDGKSDEEGSNLIKTVINLILALDDVSSSCVIE